MLLNQIIQLASTGELRNLSVKDDTATVLDYVNLGVIELYKRFPLNVGEYVFERTLASDIYTLPNDCMWLMEAYGPVTAFGSTIPKIQELPINDPTLGYSINTISWNKIQVGPQIATGMISIIYAVTAPQYTIDDLNTEVALPEQFIEPLLNYIGYRGHGALDGNIQAESNTHYQRFERGCERIRKEGMYTRDTVDMDNRIIDRGFV